MAEKGIDMEWLTDATLSVVVVGASGDLAKKKTYPSLLNLFSASGRLLPKETRIYGFSRSEMTDDDLRDRIRPYLEGSRHSKEMIDLFLSRCFYQQGKSYGDEEAFKILNETVEKFEVSCEDRSRKNRLFYFAIPPNVFAETALAIKKTSMQNPDVGFTRLIVEKPFGRDLESFEELNRKLSEHFTEDHLYRIDHYLGKEMVQNLVVLRFSNIWFERIWNSDNIQCVILTFKEPFGTEGRGGYFDKFGIIRDVLQNHLLQVLTLLAMETPVKVEGPGASKAIRDAKVAVLNSIPPIQLEDVVLGQYEGYSDDPTIENKDTNTPTFATIKLSVNTPRWYGVPFILKAGKATNERKAEMRIQFKDPKAAPFLFETHGDNSCPRNELVMRMQPDEAVYLKTNVKSPGFAAKPIQSELEVNYDTRFFAHQDEANPDAYTRLILDVLQGKHAAFVRDDELRRAWEIFTPLLHRIENEGVKPIVYKPGTRGPIESDDFIEKEAGYIRNDDYIFHSGGVAEKPQKALPLESYGEEKLCDIGVYGQSVMGANLSLNIAEKGFRVVAGNRSHPKVEATVQRAIEENISTLIGSTDVKDFVSLLQKPRKVIILVQAGKPVDDTIDALAQYMEPDDVIIDGGNEWFPNSIRRAENLEPKGIHFLGIGISGGEEGARHGPSLMPGGPREAYDIVAPILEKAAAQVEPFGPCVGYLGPIGAGNYVKMVHNGIEYGDMQLIAEVYDAMQNLLGMSNEEMADTFNDWNQGELESYLIEITSKILRKKDDQGQSGYVVDYILDKTGMKGTGKWTVQEGAERGAAIPTIAASLDARMLSARKEDRVQASKVLDAPAIHVSDKSKLLEGLKDALYSAKICSYAQGLSLIKAASDEYGWNIDISECARLWRGGCIIRAALLDDIQKAFKQNPSLGNLIIDEQFAGALNQRSKAWRNVVSQCILSGIACPSLSSSLSYMEAFRRERLPANLTQAQRDFFGGHTYERIDKEGRFHTIWTSAHKGIGDTSQRTQGETLQT